MFANEPWSSHTEDSQIETESFPGHLKVLIPALTARARYDSEALAQLAQLGGDRDPRTRQRVLKSQLQAGVGDRHALLEVALKDSDARVREAALLDICSSAPSECESLIPLIACSLAEKLPRLRSLASEALRRIATTKDDLLGSIHRCLYANSTTLTRTPSGRSGTGKKASRKSALLGPAEILEVRRAALEALSYPHGSRSTQVALIDFWDRREHALDSELVSALCCCPEPAVVAEELQSRLNSGPPHEALRALQALAAFQLPDLRPTFLRYAESDDLQWMKAAITGLAPIAQAEDLELLCRVSERTKPHI